METSIDTIQSVSTFANNVKPVNFTDGDILISILLITLILTHIFGGLHNMLVGIKVKKQQYD